jgi:hypothetical protein
MNEPTTIIAGLKQQKIGWRWLRIIGVLLFGSFLLLMILPNVGCLYDPELARLAKSMRHVGPFLVYSDIWVVFAYFLLAVSFVIFGTVRRNKFELAGWIMLGLVVLGMIAGG